MAEPTEIIAYKGFKKDFTCRGHQYEVGKTYTTDGPIEICQNGFHACENPFDVWSYYDMLDSRFAEVRLSGEMDMDNGDDTKIAAASISVTAELTFPEFIQRCIQWLLRATRGAEEDGSSGDGAKIGSSGNDARIGSSGECAQIASSGYSAQIGSSGHSVKIASNGHSTRIASGGNYARIASNGHSTRIASGGDYARIASGGDYARIGSSSYSARIASIGDYARIASSGYSAQIGSSGYGAQIEASGSDSVIASAGDMTRAKGAIGTWIALAEFVDGRCVGFATGCIGQGGLKPDTWYKARGGKLVEVDD